MKQTSPKRPNFETRKGAIKSEVIFPGKADESLILSVITEDPDVEKTMRLGQHLALSSLARGRGAQEAHHRPPAFHLSPARGEGERCSEGERYGEGRGPTRGVQHGMARGVWYTGTETCDVPVPGMHMDEAHAWALHTHAAML